MGRLNSKLGIITTIIVLVLIIIGINNYDKLPSSAIPDIMDPDYIKYYKKACKLGDADACFELGQIYEKGKGEVGIDFSEAYTF